MKLKSGLEVTLRPVMFPERQEANNAVVIGRMNDGSVVIKGTTKSQELWMRAGLEDVKGIKFETYEDGGRKYATDATLMRLSDGDFIELTDLIRTANTQGDYEKKE